MKKTLLTIASLLLLIVPHFAHADITSNLTAWWTFDTANMVWGSNQALDSSGNGNTLTVVNMTQGGNTVAGQVKQALSFNGSTQNALASFTPPSGDVTYSAWIYMTGGAAFNSVVVLGNNSAASRNDLYMEMGGSGSTVGFLKFVNGSFANWSSVGTVPGGSWNFISAVFHNGTGNVDFYINGIFDSSTSCTIGICSGLPSGINTAAVGSFIDDNGTYLNYFQGNIDEPHIYYRALTSSDILQLYNYTGIQLIFNMIMSMNF